MDGPGGADARKGGGAAHPTVVWGARVSGSVGGQ